MKKISLMKRTRNILGHPFGPILVLLGLMIVSTFVLEPIALAQVNPRWIFTGSLNTPRYAHTMTLLPNGKVLVVGGYTGTRLPDVTNSTELYDPATGTWTITGSLNAPRVLHTATLLPNGKVLVAGGITTTTPPDFGITNSAELYDPATGTWSATGNLNTARFWYSATVLQNGKVLVVGGGGGDNSAELYDANTGMWTVTGSLIAARYGHTATLLQNGKVLVAGGSDDGDLASTLASAELYDPATEKWSTTGSFRESRIFHTATLLPDGKVLVVGGYNWPPVSLNGAELYDPATGTWSVTGSLNTARESHTATLLPNGQVLLAAGSYDDFASNNSIILNSAELYDPATATWSVTASLNTARFGHTATLLPNGDVLVAGGYTDNWLSSAELYESLPPADTTPPETSVTSGPTGTIGVSNTTLSWTGSDNITPTGSLLYAYRLDPLEPTFSAFGSTTVKSYSNLSNGNYTFYVKAKDQAGNEDPTPASQAFTVNMTSAWTFCANENQFCSFSGTKLVRYGAGTSFTYQTATNGIGCNNATFGDPIVGTVKHCDYTDAPATTWTFCADENQFCSFSGTKLVRYGAGTSFNFQTATDGIGCNNATFGDPIFGTVKQCDITDVSID